jgi:glutathione-regulated potassium-efflux system ancillary protein KefC
MLVLAPVLGSEVPGSAGLMESDSKLWSAVKLREIFTGFALFLVVGMSAQMQQIELSMGLGAFLADVLMADSEYRHTLETDLEAFKGLLLGFFLRRHGD